MEIQQGISHCRVDDPALDRLMDYYRRVNYTTTWNDLTDIARDNVVLARELARSYDAHALGKPISRLSSQYEDWIGLAYDVLPRPIPIESHRGTSVPGDATLVRAAR